MITRDNTERERVRTAEHHDTELYLSSEGNVNTDFCRELAERRVSEVVNKQRGALRDSQ